MTPEPINLATIWQRWRTRRQPKTRHWVNGHGPFDTPEERDQQHTMLREVADWNRRAYERINEERP